MSGALERVKRMAKDAVAASTTISARMTSDAVVAMATIPACLASIVAGYVRPSVAEMVISALDQMFVSSRVRYWAYKTDELIEEMIINRILKCGAGEDADADTHTHTYAGAWRVYGEVFAGHGLDDMYACTSPDDWDALESCVASRGHARDAEVVIFTYVDRGVDSWTRFAACITAGFPRLRVCILTQNFGCDNFVDFVRLTRLDAILLYDQQTRSMDASTFLTDWANALPPSSASSSASSSPSLAPRGYKVGHGNPCIVQKAAIREIHHSKIL
jgi:hypothetical protein